MNNLIDELYNYIKNNTKAYTEPYNNFNEETLNLNLIKSRQQTIKDLSELNSKLLGLQAFCYDKLVLLQDQQTHIKKQLSNLLEEDFQLSDSRDKIYQPMLSEPTQNLQLPNLQSQNLQIPNIQHQNIQIPNIQSQNIQLPNILTQNIQLNKSQYIQDNKSVKPPSINFKDALMKNIKCDLNATPMSAKYSLDAIVIEKMDDIILEGKLYYLKNRNLFAIQLNGIKIYGNIGNIYYNEKTPPKIKDCSYGADCNRVSCTFYHSPLINSNSRDVRNFISNSWLYQDNKIQRFGSRDKLDSSLPLMNVQDRNFYSEQVMHEILCLLMLFKYIK